MRRAIREDMAVVVAQMSMGEAVKAGADAFFDEKYGETVRTVRMEEYSHELCGGTHCRATGQIGSFVITSERSIGSGLRRIEALTGAAADEYLRQQSRTLEASAEAAGGPRCPHGATAHRRTAGGTERGEASRQGGRVSSHRPIGTCGQGDQTRRDLNPRCDA